MFGSFLAVSSSRGFTECFKTASVKLRAVFLSSCLSSFGSYLCSSCKIPIIDSFPNCLIFIHDQSKKNAWYIFLCTILRVNFIKHICLIQIFLVSFQKWQDTFQSWHFFILIFFILVWKFSNECDIVHINNCIKLKNSKYSLLAQL